MEGRKFQPEPHGDMGDCQNYGPFLGPYYNTGPNTGPNLGDPKRDHNFDNPPYVKRGSKKKLPDSMAPVSGTVARFIKFP